MGNGQQRSGERASPVAAAATTAATAALGPVGGLAAQALLGNSAIQGLMQSGQSLASDPKQYAEDYASDYDNSYSVYDDYGQDSYYYGGTGTAAGRPAAGGDEAVVPEEMYEALDFDPDGWSEEAVALMNPLDALMVLQARDEAFAMTAQMFPDQGAHNNDADAFRHAYWNYRMTQSIGGSEAKKFGDAHERDSGNEQGETLMDLYNNDVGRTLAQDPENEGRPPEEVILEAIEAGTLRTTPFEVESDGS